MSLTSVIQSPEFRNLFWAHLKPTHSADLFLDSRILQRFVVLCFQNFWKVCAVIRPNWPFAHGDTSDWTIWTAAIHAVHNWPQRPRSHVVCFACDSNPCNALVIVPKTLTNLHEEMCKENTASSTLVAASLVRPHDLIPCGQQCLQRWVPIREIRKVRTVFALQVSTSGHLCYVDQCLASLTNWWGVHAAIQFISITRTEERPASVSQWRLWENRSLQSFHPRQSSDQWRVSPLQCWKPRKVELGRHLKSCDGKILWLLILLC